MAPKIKKKDGTLTKKYRDLPRYPVILKYEGDFKEGYKAIMGVAIKDFTKKLKQTVK